MRALIVIAVVFVMLSGCARVTVRMSGTAPLIRDPDWQEQKLFYLYGFFGKHRIDTKEICGNRAVEQVEAETSFFDSLIRIFTIYVLTPRTAKVWCVKGVKT